VAQLASRLDHNADGDFFVDASCIDCDTCRWMAPATFVQRQGQASVHRQPRSDAETERALLAVLSCPTGSIGCQAKHDMDTASRGLPDPIAGDVFHCGYHAESSFGAASYLIRRDEGNVLIDSPRFTRPLVRRLEEMGGVRTLFLTHRDDVADHAKFREHFGCERVLHEDEIRPGTRDVELVVRGSEPTSLDAETLVIPTPGHTEGSSCLLFRDEFLFTGDHLAWSDARGHIYGFRSACWFDWDSLVESTRALSGYAFEWILPGHGRRCHFPRERMRVEMAKALDWMESA